MIRSTWMSRGLAAAVVVATLAVGASGRAQDEAGDFSAFLPKPTKQHEVLGKDVGVWDAEIKSWMVGPDAEPTVTKGVERNRLLRGGLWLVSDFEGDVGGIPFAGHGQTGYDPKQGKYIGTWVDSMSTNVMTQEGTYDEAAETFTFEGEAVDPAGQTMEQKTIASYKGDTRTMEMHMKLPGSDEYIKMMEITYTKRADSP